jgi:hypothetical protein
MGTHDRCRKKRAGSRGHLYPICSAGKRNCPPEDCGGPWGYQDLIAILADPSHPDHKEQREWIDEDFDPDTFDIGTANAVLAARFRKK